MTVRTFNQEGTEVITFRRTVMVYKAGAAPKLPRFKGPANDPTA